MRTPTGTGLVILQPTGLAPPAVHLIRLHSTSSKATATTRLATTGWSPTGAWIPRSWGSIVAVQPDHRREQEATQGR